MNGQGGSKTTLLSDSSSLSGQPMVGLQGDNLIVGQSSHNADKRWGGTTGLLQQWHGCNMATRRQQGTQTQLGSTRTVR